MKQPETFWLKNRFVIISQSLSPPPKNPFKKKRPYFGHCEEQSDAAISWFINVLRLLHFARNDNTVEIDVVPARSNI
jgi:hypothetical protein